MTPSVPPAAGLGAPAAAGAAPGHWLSLQRIAVYPRIFAAIYAIAAIAWVVLSTDLIDLKGKPLGYDFITFWAGSLLALGGEAAASFDLARILAAEQVAVPANDQVFLWHYPPTFHLIVLPLALLPYLLAYAAWLAATFAAFAWIVRRIAPRPETLWLLLAFPGTFINAFHGQNGFLIAALFGGALLLLERRPVLAGVLFGVMSCKPQLGLLVPIALLFGRQWTAFAAAAATTLAFAGVSAVVIGVDTWLAFWKNLPLVRLLLDSGDLPWAKIPSLYIALRMLGLAAPLAYALHAMLVLAVAAIVARVWRRGRSLILNGAVLVSGGLLVPPYLFDYDLALLAIPIAILAWDGVRRGWLRHEREVLAAAWLAPLAAPGIAAWLGAPVAVLCLLALFAIAVRRATNFDQARAD
jgi:alpha-1,2-mannosyltransferase